MKRSSGGRHINLTCLFIIALALYAISSFVLWQGYQTLPSPNSETGPRPMDPLIFPVVAFGLAGIWLARAIPALSWIWIAALSFWTYWNVRYLLEGKLFIDGRHGCVLCEASITLLLVATLGWLLIAVIVWLATRAKRLIA